MDEYLEQMERQQVALQKHLNHPPIREKDIRYIAGMDVQHGENFGIVAYQVFDYHSGQILEENTFRLKETFPYIQGFLYYREREFMNTAFEAMKLKPNVVACDGNGKFHPRLMGEAMQFGIENNIPTIGIAKKKMYMDNINEVNNGFYLNGIEIGRKVFLGKNSKIPMIISEGYRMNLDTAVKVCMHMQKFSQESKYSYLTKGSDHIARMEQKKYL